jgi:hypothetical protein
MNENAQKAFDKLRTIGAPVFDRTDYAGHFMIIGEQAGKDDYFYPGSKDYAADSMSWAEYYSEDHTEAYSRFGVHNDINDILNEYGLYAEWQDCATLNVWDS